MTVLVTGALGWTAQSIVKALADAGESIVGLDLKSASPDPDVARFFKKLHIGDIASFDLVQRTVENVDAVVHLAVAIDDGAYTTPKRPFQTTVRGTANIFEAMRQAKLSPRVVLMGSAPFHVVGDDFISARDDCRVSDGGDFMYDLTKCLQETIAKRYSDAFGFNVVTLGAGHIVDGVAEIDPKGRSLADLAYGRGFWVCRYDLAQAVLKALAYPHGGYDAFDVIGANAARRNIEVARTEHILGHVNATTFESYS